LALFGKIGSLIGLPSAQQTVGTLFGPAAGQVAGTVSSGISNLTANIPVLGSGPDQGPPTTATDMGTPSPGVTPLPNPYFSTIADVQTPMQSGTGVIGGLTKLFPQLAKPAKNLFPGLVGGLGAGAVIDFVVDQFGNPRRLIITRKMQREVKELFMYLGGDLNAVAEVYSRFKGVSFSADNIFKILLKKFRNDGPMVTKAAVRKTRRTIRKLDALQALYNDIRPKAKPRTRARSMTASRVTQIKN
jgi:hypothetical protein